LRLEPHYITLLR